ncbi:MAG: oligosaccharide flippase family protein, partial [Deltaproteobacteria bacterium]|nr:oligosaccharide flippase family protein [Deltaproteobacteria bacterium]
MSFRSNFTWMLGSKFGSIILGSLTSALINRSLGTNGRGIYAEVLTWVGLFTVIFGLSMDSAIYHCANKSVYGNDDKSRFTTMFLLSCIYAALAAVFLSFLAIFWPEQFSTRTANLMLLIDIYLILSMLVANMTVFVQSLGHMKLSALIGVLTTVLNTAIIGTAYFWKYIDVKFMVISTIFIQAFTIFFLYWALSDHGLLGGRFSKSLAKGLIVSGLKQHIATIATFFYMKINQLILLRYWGHDEVGIFAVSLNLAFALMFIPTTFREVLYPRVIHSSDEYEVTVRAMRLGFYGWGLVVLITILLAQPILLLYGGKAFLPSVNIFRILMIAAWLLPLSSLLAPLYIKMGAFGVASCSAIILGIF